MAGLVVDIGPELRATIELLIGAFLLWRTEKVRRELKPNGGSSLRDAIDAIHNRLDQAGFDKAPVDRDLPPPQA